MRMDFKLYEMKYCLLILSFVLSTSLFAQKPLQKIEPIGFAHVNVQYQLEDGYAIVQKTWRKGDVVEITLPMDVKLVNGRKEIKQTNDRVAIQRGPLVYCIESRSARGNGFGRWIERADGKEDHHRHSILCMGQQGTIANAGLVAGEY